MFAQEPLVPLAEALRPQTLDEIVGQSHLMGKGKPRAWARANRSRLAWTDFVPYYKQFIFIHPSFTHPSPSPSHKTEIFMIASLFTLFIKKIIRTKPPKQTRRPELMVFKCHDKNYILINSKAVGGSTNGVPDDTVQKLTRDKNGVRQMSSKWIENNLRIMVNEGETSKEEKQEIMAGLKNGATKRIYAQTDANGTTYHVIEDVMKEGKPDPKDACVSNVAWKSVDVVMFIIEPHVQAARH